MTIYGGNFSDSFINKQPKENVGTQQQQDIVNEMLHLGFVSRGTFENKKQQHAEWTEQSQYNNTFVHCQYHKVVFNKETYTIHQQQYYNHNYNDHRSPGYTQIVVIRYFEDKIEERLGVYLMDTKEYIKDLQTLEIIKRVS
jgi:DNA polymerase III delta prime subunit